MGIGGGAPCLNKPEAAKEKTQSKQRKGGDWGSYKEKWAAWGNFRSGGKRTNP